MRQLPTPPLRLAAFLAAVSATLAVATPHPLVAQSRTYGQLTSLFAEWRAFEEPRRINAIPDYGRANNALRLRGVARLLNTLSRIDTTGWTVPEQVDLHIVRAEMNGLKYNLTVLTPWSRDPAYYVSIRTEQSDTPAEEGPIIHGAIRLWQYPVWPRTRFETSRPLNAEQSADLAARLRTIPTLLRQARINLAPGNAKDLWVGAVKPFDEQHEALLELRKLVGSGDAALGAAVDGAAEATKSFTDWLRVEAPKKTGPSGIGKANYTWFLKNVLLMPLTWEDEITITRRELARAHASLRLEEQRNKDLPPMPVAETKEAYEALQDASIKRYIAFVRDRGMVTYEPWMEGALRERTAPFAPPEARNFFAQTYVRDPIPLWTHLWHWWDNGRFREHPHPSVIRRTPLLYNVWMSRSEGMATSMEEWMMHAGLYGVSPRSREIVWAMLANRAARGLGNLYAHSNELTMAQASDVHVRWTPRGWMKRDPLLGFEQHLYLRQPGYGATYVTGGRLMEETMAERARQLGDQFTMKRFFDEVNGAGMIPVSLIYWELTGDDRMVRELKEGVTPRPFR
jgi:Bacterial protein of unknown function (DUF885)